MLVTTHLGRKVHIGPLVTVTVAEVEGTLIGLKIEAPRGACVHKEVSLALQRIGDFTADGEVPPHSE